MHIGLLLGILVCSIALVQAASSGPPSFYIRDAQWKSYLAIIPGATPTKGFLAMTKVDFKGPKLSMGLLESEESPEVLETKLPPGCRLLKVNAQRQLYCADQGSSGQTYYFELTGTVGTDFTMASKVARPIILDGYGKIVGQDKLVSITEKYLFISGDEMKWEEKSATQWALSERNGAPVQASIIDSPDPIFSGRSIRVNGNKLQLILSSGEKLDVGADGKIENSGKWVKFEEVGRAAQFVKISWASSSADATVFELQPVALDPLSLFLRIFKASVGPVWLATTGALVLRLEFRHETPHILKKAMVVGKEHYWAVFSEYGFMEVLERQLATARELYSFYLYSGLPEYWQGLDLTNDRLNVVHYRPLFGTES